MVNNYGLSETTVVATSGAVAADGDGAPSIGRPIAGVVAEIVDERLQPVEPGGDGELVLGGVAIARGYLNRPELTAERFIDGPRAAGTGPAIACVCERTGRSSSSGASMTSSASAGSGSSQARSQPP